MLHSGGSLLLGGLVTFRRLLLSWDHYFWGIVNFRGRYFRGGGGSLLLGGHYFSGAITFEEQKMLHKVGSTELFNDGNL